MDGLVENKGRKNYSWHAKWCSMSRPDVGQAQDKEPRPGRSFGRSRGATVPKREYVHGRSAGVSSPQLQSEKWAILNYPGLLARIPHYLRFRGFSRKGPRRWCLTSFFTPAATTPGVLF